MFFSVNLRSFGCNKMADCSWSVLHGILEPFCCVHRIWRLVYTVGFIWWLFGVWKSGFVNPFGPESCSKTQKESCDRGGTDILLDFVLQWLQTAARGLSWETCKYLKIFERNSLAKNVNYLLTFMLFQSYMTDFFLVAIHFHAVFIQQRLMVTELSCPALSSRKWIIQGLNNLKADNDRISYVEWIIPLIFAFFILFFLFFSHLEIHGYFYVVNPHSDACENVFSPRLFFTFFFCECRVYTVL